MHSVVRELEEMCPHTSAPETAAASRTPTSEQRPITHTINTRSLDNVALLGKVLRIPYAPTLSILPDEVVKDLEKD
jgi:hypothetical protein